MVLGKKWKSPIMAIPIVQCMYYYVNQWIEMISQTIFAFSTSFIVQFITVNVQYTVHLGRSHSLPSVAAHLPLCACFRLL